MSDQLIAVFHNTSIYNRKPWHVGVLAGSRGPVDDTLGTYTCPVDAIEAAFEAQKVMRLPVRIPLYLVERFESREVVHA